jgi:hypothetical protein
VDETRTTAQIVSNETQSNLLARREVQHAHALNTLHAFKPPQAPHPPELQAAETVAEVPLATLLAPVAGTAPKKRTLR